MQQAVSARAPAHLWVVGILATLWNAFGCYDYLMTNMRNETYLAQFTSEQLAYFESLPSWLTAAWAIGVWGGLAGSLLLLIRSRYSVWAFALSLIGAVIGMGYQMFATTMPESMKSGAMAIMPWVIIVIAAFLLWYSWDADKKGVLR
ncbi:MAG TPA: hypothetical protein VFM42_07025 [Sphingomicrobium sp.]|jgi:hypothetical protein|nr:hypothetical protein [Sphingomicrobium sp.]